MKIRISQIKNEIQREKVRSNQQGAASLSSSTCQGCQLCVRVQRTTKGAKAMERLRKKLSEQESLLLLMSPSMAFRVANRNGKVSLCLRLRLPAAHGAALCWLQSALCYVAGLHLPHLVGLRARRVEGDHP